MPNVTISLEDELIKVGRDYAQRHKTSLNALIRDLLSKHVLEKSTEAWMGECIKKMKQSKGNSRGKKWAREDLYRV